MPSKDELASRIEKSIETPMIVLALLAVPVVLIELEIVPTNAYWVSFATKIDDGIWFAFLMEYLVLISLYDEKIEYTKRSWSNLIILMLSPPLISPQGFAFIRSLRSLRALRLFRALRSLRILIALNRGIKPIFNVLVKNSLHYVTFISVAIIIIAGIAFSRIEDQEFLQGVWWAITTVTTVGYGDLYPESNTGKILAVVVMIVGIGFVSILTANIASYFVEKDIENKNQDVGNEDKNQLILERIEELSNKIDEINQRLP